MAIQEKGVLRKELYELLVDGNLVKVIKSLDENEVSKFEFKDIAEKAYSQLMKDANVTLALSICEQFSLPAELKNEAVSAHFRKLGEEKEYERAFEWGIKHNMSKNDMNNLSVRAFNHALKDKNISTSLEYIQKFEIPHNLIIDDARRSFNELFEEGLYQKALYLGKEFEMSPKRTLTSGLKGYQVLLSKEKIKDFVAIEQSFRILHDRDISEVEEKHVKDFSKIFYDLLVCKYFEQNKPDKLYDILISLEFFEDTAQNKLLPELIIKVKTEAEKIHAKLLAEERGPAACEIVKNFKLLAEDTQEELRTKVIKSAEDTHHILMKNNNLKGALFLKENYELFLRNALENSQAGMNLASREYLKKCLSNGNYEDANIVIKKYEMEGQAITDITARVILSFAFSEQYGIIFEIMRTFKPNITDPDILTEITSRFHQAYESDKMEIASNFDFYFKLKEFRARKATLVYWESLINKSKYSEAFALKKERKIPKKILEPILKKICETMKSNSQNYEANKLIEQYKLKTSFWAAIIGFFRRLFGR